MTTPVGVAELSRHQPSRILLGRVVEPPRIWDLGAVAVKGGRILAVGARRDVLARLTPDSDAEIADWKDNWLIPGMIDLHVHGAGGADVMNGTRQALSTVARVVAEGGATAFLATTRTAPRESLLAVAQMVAEVTQQPSSGTAQGATVLGLNLEGPYISPERSGGQPRQYIREPDLAELVEIHEAARGHLRLVTHAPERPGGLQMTDWLHDHGIIPALGHSNADYQEALEAVEHGVTHYTHAFNAMTPLRHRDPGGLMAGLLAEAVTIELIADGVHVHPAALKLAYRLKGPERIALVTDASAAGLAPGRYELAHRSLVIDDESVRLANGTLAGSKLQLNRALQVMVEQAGVALSDAVQMASTIPARVLGLSNTKGVLAPGYDADVTVLAPDFSVVAVMIAGEWVVNQGKVLSSDAAHRPDARGHDPRRISPDLNS